jgi:hypothetical protein
MASWWEMDYRLELDILSSMPIPLCTTQIGLWVVKKVIPLEIILEMVVALAEVVTVMGLLQVDGVVV